MGLTLCGCQHWQVLSACFSVHDQIPCCGVGQEVGWGAGRTGFKRPHKLFWRGGKGGGGVSSKQGGVCAHRPVSSGMR